MFSGITPYACIRSLNPVNATYQFVYATLRAAYIYQASSRQSLSSNSNYSFVPVPSSLPILSLILKPCMNMRKVNLTQF